jgi:hypothetical protein
MFIPIKLTALLTELIRLFNPKKGELTVFSSAADSPTSASTKPTTTRGSGSSLLISARSLTRT